MDDVKREADTLDSLTLNIKEIGSQVGHIKLSCIITYNYIILCHIILNHIISYYIALYYIILYHIMLYYIKSYYIILYCIVLYYFILPSLK